MPGARYEGPRPPEKYAHIVPKRRAFPGSGAQPVRSQPLGNIRACRRSAQMGSANAPTTSTSPGMSQTTSTVTNP
jgi:hypothetical protein